MAESSSKLTCIEALKSDSENSESDFFQEQDSKGELDEFGILDFF